MKRTLKEWAALLDGREYRCEVTREEEADAKSDGVVIMFGASGSLCELRGVICDEENCYGGDTLFLTAQGFFESKCGDVFCPYTEAEQKKCKAIEAIWCDPESNFPWSYETDIPHETFDILEDGVPWCRGIVFHVDSLKEDA